MTTCPRCTSAFAPADGLCFTCLLEMKGERDLGVAVDRDQWPIEGLAEFRTAALASEVIEDPDDKL